MSKPYPTFQEIIRRLSLFWEKQGCIIHQPYDMETGAGTFNPATFLRSLGPEPYNAAYVEPCRRPTDGRYGTNPNRIQHYFQYQVIMKPSPANIQDLYLQSLEAIGLDLKEHDIRFVHDDWEQATIGAWGLGWEVWLDGMEITQFTYFQALGGVELKPITGEITYGLERVALYLQKVNSFFDLKWNDDLTYGDIYHQNEVEWSHYNFEKASTDMWFKHFDDYEREAKKLMDLNLPIPAYDFVIKASHAFNLLNARGAISVTERTGYITRIRELATRIAESFAKARATQNHPLMKRFADHTLKKEKLPPIPSAEAISRNGREDFLLEIGSEELPATFVPIGCANLEKGIKELLETHDLPHNAVKVYGTPRRLSVMVEGLATSKAARAIEKRGPAVTQAYDDKGKALTPAEGFFRSLNRDVASLDSIRAGKVPGVDIRDVKGSEYLFSTTQSAGQSTAQILADHLPNLILNLDFPKKMRWGNLDITYARPLRWIVALFGKEIIPFQVGNITSGRTSQGHRQRHAGAFDLTKAQDYVDALRKHEVIVDIDERRNSIVSQLHALEKKLGATALAQDKVIPQVLHLVEKPTLTSMTFDTHFLRAPKEVLISEMVEHQKYFPVANEKGELKNLFIITADTEPTDAIREGNNKVLSARLSDGVFLYETDVKVPLEARNEKLKQVTFQKELGSVFDKVTRLSKHVEVLHHRLNVGDTKKLQRAAILSKADLASDVVYEFPELQGVIGKQYAIVQGEDREVAQAIDEQWMPRGEHAPLPTSVTGTLLSLAEKMDNLLGCFGAGLKPKSSSDPYALRRQMLGIIKILIQGEYHLPFLDTFRECFAAFPKGFAGNRDEVLQEIEGFTLNRIRTVFLDYGFLKDEIEASLSTGFTDIYDTFRKVNALHQFRATNPKFSSLLEVYRRAKGQTTNYAPQKVSESLIKQPAEIELHKTLSGLQGSFAKAIKDKDYDKAYELIAELQPPLAKLFDEVKILDDDASIRNNRIALLQRVFSLFEQLVDFSKIQEKAIATV